MKNKQLLSKQIQRLKNERDSHCVVSIHVVWAHVCVCVCVSLEFQGKCMMKNDA